MTTERRKVEGRGEAEDLLKRWRDTDLPLAAGTHQIRVTNLEKGIDDTQTIEVQPGEFVRVVVEDPTEQLDEDLQDLWAPVRPERPQEVIDVEREDGDDEAPKSGKRPPRSSKKR